MTAHTYTPGPDEFCQVCQEPLDYCTGSRQRARPERPGQVPQLVPASANGHAPEGDTEAAKSRPSAPPGRQVVVTLASQIKPRPVRWLWPDRIPAGALTLLAGREGIGKSLVGVRLAAELTRGTLPGERHGRPSRVMFATSEDA